MSFSREEGEGFYTPGVYLIFSLPSVFRYHGLSKQDTVVTVLSLRESPERVGGGGGGVLHLVALTRALSSKFFIPWYSESIVQIRSTSQHLFYNTIS
jgi:hypothetical protein